VKVNWPYKKETAGWPKQTQEVEERKPSWMEVQVRALQDV